MYSGTCNPCICTYFFTVQVQAAATRISVFYKQLYVIPKYDLN